ncbi:hypothetical protein L226DRAFT_564390 [Lentinus tigrinus ALCF2SS1-7]|uniref:uncharacterized protein n=1 Tax=Lentinus tigrinus ALCF2SS1-7 TaxID=1328758 RepID=UPI0011663100|nr:hypothetical protein L226DRAFT_564390 [Lentinus tigrinus ALCF2SS1-7]
MRSPVIAFSILAAAAVSPVLVSGAPTSPKLGNAMTQTDKLATGKLAHQVRGTPDIEKLVGSLPNPAEPSATPTSTPTNDPVHRTQAMKNAKAQTNQPNIKAAVPPPAAKMSKRASDMYTAGGNAYSGAASDSSGGDIQNASDQGTLTNGDGSNAAGGAGSSFSGFSFGGNGNGHGPGGNAYTGATGASRGGNVVNTSEGNTGDADAIDNTTANTAGGGGFSESGSAEGGNAASPRLPDGVQRRASDSGTAGGNAYSGATSDVSGGSVVNAADDQGTVTNGGGNTAGGAGTTFSGDADGGNGNGFGPGGNAYTGASGPAVGGSIYNYGGTVDNAAGSNAAGGGGNSVTGDATGGRA